MIKSGKYALYCGKEYKLNRDMKGNYIIITKDRDCIDASFVDKYGGGVYTKIVELSQLDAIYSVTVYGLVDGEKVLVMQESEDKYYVEISDCETGDKLKSDRIDKYGYGGWIPSDHIQIMEEKNYIKAKEE